MGGRGDERRLAAAAGAAPLRNAEDRAAPAPLRPPPDPCCRRPRRDGGRSCDRLFAEPVSRRSLAELLLERQGIVTRDGVRAEGIPGGYGAVYSELRALETLGLCRRGYFVEGLGGAQFALGGAVERLRELRPREGEEPQPLVLAAADPAQPYGAALPWPKRATGRAARVAGATVVLLGGEAALFVERGGKTLLPLRDPEEDWLRVALDALVEHTRRAGGRKRRLAVERFDGEPVAETAVMPILLEAGFVAGPRRAVLRPDLCPKATPSTARRRGCALSSASGCPSRPCIRGLVPPESPSDSTGAASKPWRLTARTSCSASRAAECSAATSACRGAGGRWRPTRRCGACRGSC